MINQTLLAQASDSVIRQKRLKPLIITAGGVYGLSMAALDQLWYANHKRESFHFFNDNQEWKQMDKAGHAYAAFQLGAAGSNALRWAGVPEKQSLLYGSLSGFLSMASIEILDGFSSAYGASYGDMIANATGTLLFYGQQKMWKELRIHPKYSFKTTRYPQYRPSVLGKNLLEQAFKDYNGQIYWLSLDLSKLTAAHKFPKWLNIAVGYGAQGMLYAADEANKNAGLYPRQQYYISLDLDLNEYKSRSQVVNLMLYVLNMIHIPAPTLEYSSGKFKFYYIF